MTKSSKDVDAIIAKTPDWRGATLAKVRKIVRSADPELTEAAKWKRPANPLGVALWEREGIVLAAPILKERVRLSFFNGASLADPKRLFNARLDGTKERAIDIAEGDKINETALKALVKAGVAHNLAKSKARKK